MYKIFRLPNTNPPNHPRLFTIPSHTVSHPPMVSHLIPNQPSHTVSYLPPADHQITDQCPTDTKVLVFFIYKPRTVIGLWPTQNLFIYLCIIYLCKILFMLCWLVSNSSTSAFINICHYFKCAWSYLRSISVNAQRN